MSNEARECLERMAVRAVKLNEEGFGDEMMARRIQAALRELVEIVLADADLPIGWQKRQVGQAVFDITELEDD